jgi:hypothetical protein
MKNSTSRSIRKLVDGGLEQCADIGCVEDVLAELGCNLGEALLPGRPSSVRFVNPNSSSALCIRIVIRIEVWT